MSNRILKIFRFGIISVLLIAPVSCEDALEENIYSFIGKENFYKNKDDANAAIVGLYGNNSGGVAHLNVYGRWWYDVIHLLDDQCTIHRNESFIELDNFNLSADHPYILALWTGLYRVINNANVAVVRIPEIDMDESLKNSLVAEARCIRASMYFYLVRLWGNVPLTIDEIKDEESANPPMSSSIDEIYESIIQDLEYAEEKLPATRDSKEFGRVTKWAAKALLTDVLLTRENWSEAAQKANEIIQSGQFSLLSDFTDIFHISNENNEEIIYSIPFDGIYVSNCMVAFSHVGGAANANTFSGSQVVQVDEKSDMWLNWSKKDLRRNYSVYDEYLTKDGTYASVYDYSRPYPGFGKWNDPEETGNYLKSQNNVIVYRFADILLMYSEAISQSSGPNNEAYETFNMVRRRGYGKSIDQISEYDLTTGLNATAFQDSVIKERSHEFVVEGKRLFDLIRTGQYPQILIDMGKVVNPGANLLPIPIAEIEANSSFTSEIQNEGY